ncbi:MAG: hypothetical protein RSD40_00130 [Bacilli bacterium]
MKNNYFSYIYDRITENFSRPFIDREVNHPYNNEHVWECLKNIANSPQSRITHNCRLYQRGRQVGIFDAKCKIEQVCNFDSLEMVKWDDVFGKDDFLIFINHAAIYSRDLLEASRQFIGNFTEHFEPYGISIEHHLIIGRYSETPFGVHVDDPTDRVFHFNLGPSEKYIHLWSRKVFMKLYHNDSARPLESVSLEKSESYEIPVGGCFFLPADYHHVGKSIKDVSVVVALAFSRLSESLLLNEALSELKKKFPVKISPLSYYSNFSIEVDSPDKLFEAYDDFGLTSASLHAVTRRKSNGCFTEVHPLSMISIIELEGYYVLIDNRRPLYIRQNKVLYIYAAGHQIILSKSILIKEFFYILQQKEFSIPPLYGGESLDFMQVIALRAWLVMTNTSILQK